MYKDTRLDVVISALLKPLEDFLEKKVVGYTEKFANINTALSTLEKGTIKVLTEQVNLWELETGVYYLDGGFKYKTDLYVSGGSRHIFLIYKPIPSKNAVRYIHFCGNYKNDTWSSVECGYTDGTTLKEYYIVDTSKVTSDITKDVLGVLIPNTTAVKSYVNSFEHIKTITLAKSERLYIQDLEAGIYKLEPTEGNSTVYLGKSPTSINGSSYLLVSGNYTEATAESAGFTNFEKGFVFLLGFYRVSQVMAGRVKGEKGTDGTWAYSYSWGGGAIETANNKTMTIDDESTANHVKYPSAKAVKEYVDTVIGGIENGSY